MAMREDVEAVVQGILEGRILETFDAFYDDNVTMSENGIGERFGKAENRQYEEQFVNGVEFHTARAGAILVDGDHAAVEWELEFTPKGGERIIQHQVSVQTWRAGKIVREVFYHG